MRELYRTVERGDLDRAARLVAPEAFVYTPTTRGVLVGRGAFLADLRSWHDELKTQGTTLRMVSGHLRSGSSGSGRSAWVFDNLEAEQQRKGITVCRVPIRLTALLVDRGEWQIEAAYWSVPFETQEQQDALKHDGRLEPGMPLEEAVAADARPLVEALTGALQDPSTLPGLYSIQEESVTIGSVVDEIFLGPSGRSAWEEFVGYGPQLELRGGIRAALVEPTVGWLATNVDVTFDSPTPYRFFYVWRREQRAWRIVVSHDSVSVDPFRRP